MKTRQDSPQGFGNVKNGDAVFAEQGKWQKSLAQQAFSACGTSLSYWERCKVQATRGFVTAANVAAPRFDLNAIGAVVNPGLSTRRRDVSRATAQLCAADGKEAVLF